MTQQAADPIRQAQDYLRHLAAKGFPELGEQMRRTAADWQRCLEGMSEEQALHQPSPDPSAPGGPATGEGPKWCAKEVIGHYLSGERGLNRSVAVIAGVPPPDPTVPYVTRMGEQSTDDQAQPIDELRRRLAAFFEETIAFLDDLEKSDSLDGTFPHPVFGPLNAKEWIAFHRLHAMDHIQQIDKIKADPGFPSA